MSISVGTCWIKTLSKQNSKKSRIYMCMLHGFMLAIPFNYAPPAYAGPPYVTDDPEPTDPGHFEIYNFVSGENVHKGYENAAGIDFNYGAFKDVQLTVVVPFEWQHSRGESHVSGLSQVDLAVKYEFLHQEKNGIDLAFFPEVSLPSVSHKVGDRRASMFLPLWAQRQWKKLTIFGGGGWTYNPGHDRRNFAMMGIAATWQLTPRWQIGTEIYHEGRDAPDAKAHTGVGFGTTYDLTEHIHLMASAGPGIQHRTNTAHSSWYFSILTTF